MAIKVDFTFDETNYRHYMNGFLTVLHCHHYLCLTTKMAEDFNDIGGRKVLMESAEDSIRPLLDDYFNRNNVLNIEEKLMVGAEYYAVMGLGKMKIKAGQQGGEVQLAKSHIDEGWLNKWGTHEAHINHFTCGFVASIFAAAFEKPARSYSVSERQSIVTGASFSHFNVTAV